MKIVRNRLLPIGRRYSAINLFGILFVKPGVRLSDQLLRHETIHTRQMRELLYLPFYLMYVAEWLWHLVRLRGDAYRAYLAISFEREAYLNQNDTAYLASRRRFAPLRRNAD